MFRFVMQFETELIEKDTWALIAHELLFVFVSRWQASVDIPEKQKTNIQKLTNNNNFVGKYSQ